ncbi:recombinase family protein [Agrobacterium vitis]|uniref:Recombinase family protein n=1 Tax=Agrobacterium vitis TaxID=373 RepID=A0ABD6GFL5_AGRVI|nr:recombinase family protein [Agrobacterium vitis]MUO79701.1 recombinase family protein [Agrobacterium vitis]MUO96853.1 recombinase family protein [Agrobacterium vitis]MUP07686.1 recombinase family protein [Agrobacterium vitis]MUZ83630.1 recombinase family protein [Agrobacterium vitis]MVA11879.1 recombinase family protein [Agrobacterium vitis]
MKLIGYARVSTVEQNLDLQVSALQIAGCSEIFTDQGLSGADFQRPGLRKALRNLKDADMLVVWRLDRLGRSLIDLIETVDRLAKRGCEFRSLTENIDTSSSGGRLVFHMMAAMAEFERAIISERTKAGMEAARARGSRLGRRPSMTDAQTCAARHAIEIDQRPISEVAAKYNIHPKTLARILRTSGMSYTSS